MSDVLGILSLRSSGQMGRLDNLTCKCDLNDKDICVAFSCIMATAAWARAPSNKGNILLGAASSFWLTSMLESNSSNTFTTTQYWPVGSSATRTPVMSSLWCSSRKAWKTAMYSSSSRRLAWDISALLLSRNFTDRHPNMKIFSRISLLFPRRFPRQNAKTVTTVSSLSRPFGMPGSKVRPSRHLSTAEGLIGRKKNILPPIGCLRCPFFRLLPLKER